MAKAAAIFSSNMVLQRRKNVRIWGTCYDEKNIFVKIPELGVSVKAIVNGENWKAVLPPMEAVDCCKLIVESESETVTLENVAVGEVWFAGGQSNMELELKDCLDGEAELKKCSETKIRYYYTEKCSYLDEILPIRERKNSWKTPSEETSANWSAVAYFFAKKLSADLGVTVGILGCNWGGTSASAWMSREKLESDTAIRSYLDEYDKSIEGKTEVEMVWEYNDYLVYEKKWNEKKDICYKENPNISYDEVVKKCGENKWPGPMGVKNPYRPCGLHETMIKRVAPYTLAGFLYYQGESDDHKPDVYEKLLTALIEQWRSDWEDYRLPFMMVQLPMFKYAGDDDKKNWPVIREAQMKVFNSLKNTGLAVILDCGEFNNLHPANKKPVGERLELQALYNVYGKRETEAFPPMYTSYSVKDDSMELYFDCAEDGLKVNGKLSGFELAGEDEVYYPATAELKGNVIVISSAKVATPVNARYLWTNYGDVTLFGKNGIPVPSFRTTIK